MTANDVARMIDRLTDRVDRLENGGEIESEVAIQEREEETVTVADEAVVDEDITASETVATEDAIRETVLDVRDEWRWADPDDERAADDGEGAQWGAARWSDPFDT